MSVPIPVPFRKEGNVWDSRAQWTESRNKNTAWGILLFPFSMIHWFLHWKQYIYWSPLSLWLLLSKTQVTGRCGGVSVNGFFCTREVSTGWNIPWHPTQVGNQFSGLSISGLLGVKSIKRGKAMWFDGCRVDSLANHTSFTPRGIGGSRRGLILRGWRTGTEVRVPSSLGVHHVLFFECFWGLQNREPVWSAAPPGVSGTVLLLQIKITLS